MKARTNQYGGKESVRRFEVPDHKVWWEVEWPEYAPPEVTFPVVLQGPEWADPDISGKYLQAKAQKRQALKFNKIDGKVNRRSHMGQYKIIQGLPRFLHIYCSHFLEAFYCLFVSQIISHGNFS